MYEALTTQFLFTYADRKKRANHVEVKMTHTHGLSTWVNETNVRNKFKLAIQNAGMNYEEVTLLIPALVHHCISEQMNGDEIPNAVFQFLVYGSKDALESRPRPRLAPTPQKPKIGRRDPNLKALAKIWKTAICGQDEEGSKFNFIEYSLLEDIYSMLSKNFTMSQNKKLRKEWPNSSRKLFWGGIQKLIESREDEPTSAHYLKYFKDLAHELMGQKTPSICEIEFRELGKDQKGILYPFDDEIAERILAQRERDKPPPPKPHVPVCPKRHLEVQKSHGFYRDAMGNMQWDEKRIDEKRIKIMSSRKPQED